MLERPGPVDLRVEHIESRKSLGRYIELVAPIREADHVRRRDVCDDLLDRVNERLVELRRGRGLR